MMWWIVPISIWTVTAFATISLYSKIFTTSQSQLLFGLPQAAVEVRHEV
ncbi:TPA: hypothetical protein U5D96_004538 [Yersinia enterocolitica]|nr:hypothetical protein [Yersinia enterocolitica]